MMSRIHAWSDRVRAVTLGAVVKNYGFTEIMREYARFPRVLPFPAYMEHGWSLVDAPRETDLRHHTSAMLVFNERRARAWRRASRVPVAVMGAPFVHFRRMAGVELQRSARGTVAFPGHSGTVVEAQFDANAYCEELKGIPTELGPVTVCLHWDDIRRGRDECYKAHGFRIVSAGPRHSPDFARRFYEILSAHRFSTANALATNVLYSVELGVPFFLLGQPVRFVNPKGEDTVSYTESERRYVGAAEALFASPVESVTPAQMEFVTREAGLEDCLSPSDLRSFLMSVLFRRALPTVPLRLARTVRSRLARP